MLPPQERRHPGEQFGKPERLGDIVVGARVLSRHGRWEKALDGLRAVCEEAEGKDWTVSVDSHHCPRSPVLRRSTP